MRQYTLFFYKQWVHKHTQPKIMDFLSILLSIFPASDLPLGKVLLLNFVQVIFEIEPNYYSFLLFMSGVLQILEKLYEYGNLRIVCLLEYQNH